VLFRMVALPPPPPLGSDSLTVGASTLKLIISLQRRFKFYFRRGTVDRVQRLNESGSVRVS
jgi:hypothetical protein